MKKVILNQISKAVAGGSNYFYLPLHLVKEDNDKHYETSADFSKLFKADSNGVPVIKEICVYDEDYTENVYLSYSGNKGKTCEYCGKYNEHTHKLLVSGNNIIYDQIEVVESNTDETNDDSSPKDGGNN